MSDKPRHSIIRSTLVVGVCTGLSRVLGLVRMMVMTNLFGTSLLHSAFVVAFRIPNLFRRLFGEGALSAAFIPVFTEVTEKEGNESANLLLNKVTTMLALSLGVIALGGGILTLSAVKWFSLSEKWVTVMPLLRIMLPYMIFICIMALFASALNSRRNFLVPSIAPGLLNVVWILTVLFICPHFQNDAQKQISVVAWSILAAGFVQFAVLVPSLIGLGIKPWVSFEWRDRQVTRILRLMGPAALGMGVMQLNTFIGTVLAMVVADWAPASLQCAELIIYFPLGIFATALGTVLLPTFSRQAVRKESKEMLATFSLGLRCLLFVMLPAAVGLAVLARPVVGLLFERGQFDAQSTIYTTRALWFFAPGLVVFSLPKVFVPVFYSKKDTRTPVKIGLLAVAVNLFLTVIFIKTWPDGYKHAGIALASVLSSVVNCSVLVYLIERRLGAPDWKRIGRSAFRALVISLIMGLCVYFVHNLMARWLAVNMDSLFMRRLFSFAGAMFAGIIVYGGLGFVFCKDEIKDFKR